MALNLLFAALGIVSAGWLEQLPDPKWVPVVAILSLLSLGCRVMRPIGCTGLGCCWAFIYGHLGLANMIPETWQGHDIWVAGAVVDLPRKGERSQRFILETDTIVGCSQLTSGIPDQSTCENHYRLQLSYYGDRSVVPGERWLFKVRLNRPRGQANRGAFDYEAWLFRQRISATGYVRPDSNNRRLAEPGTRELLHQVRFNVMNRVEAILADSPRRGLVSALTIGESNMISATDWKILSATGTNHLLIISGLHVSLVSGLIYRLMLLIARSVWSGSAAVRFASIGASVAATAYAGLAGFGLPVQRALIMVLVVFLGLGSGRKINVRNSFSLALFGVVAVDPLAAFSTGFWLSFGAVFVLLYTFVGRYPGPSSWTGTLKNALKAQWVIFVSLSTLTAYLLLQVSLLSPLANMIAIPWVSLLVVPGLLVSMLSLIMGNEFAGFFYQISDQLLTVLFRYLAWLAELKLSWYPGSLSVTGAMLGFLAGLVLLMPKGLPGRWLGVVLFLPAVLPVISWPSFGELRMTVLDVGQGLSVVLQTRNHAMVYDTGARYSDRFDFGSAVVIPALRVRGINRLNKVIISNGDVDHAGGARSVIQMLQPFEVSSGDPERVAGIVGLNRYISACSKGQRWHWDGVSFEILHPGPHDGAAAGWQGNNSSCVLMIAIGRQRILLPGDIESEVEKHLVESGLNGVDMLVVPHHGSRTSSTPLFLNRLKPATAIVSAGYMNRFQHPDAMIVNRYMHRGARLLNTSNEGEIEIRFALPESTSISTFRRLSRRYWH
jgi:competence protein ComEC